jgi:predicted nucleic acid-binding protein
MFKNFVIDLRRRYHIKLPDSIIMATSLYLNIPIITADKDYSKVEEIDLIYFSK